MDYKVYCKAGNVELTKEEAEKIYNEKKYICTSTAVYQPHFSTAQQKIYFTKIINFKGIAQRGRFYILDYKTINKIIGDEILLA